MYNETYFNNIEQSESYQMLYPKKLKSRFILGENAAERVADIKNVKNTQSIIANGRVLGFRVEYEEH